jgi:hypothetical protein
LYYALAISLADNSVTNADGIRDKCRWKESLTAKTAVLAPPLAEPACRYTPVPDGVGPITIAMLIWQTIESAEATLG